MTWWGLFANRTLWLQAALLHFQVENFAKAASYTHNFMLVLATNPIASWLQCNSRVKRTKIIMCIIMTLHFTLPFDRGDMTAGLFFFFFPLWCYCTHSISDNGLDYFFTRPCMIEESGQAGTKENSSPPSLSYLSDHSKLETCFWLMHARPTNISSLSTITLWYTFTKLNVCKPDDPWNFICG